MAAVRRIWVDTDTASDDAVALVMAFKNPSVEVVGISVVAGNVPLDQATHVADAVIQDALAAEIRALGPLGEFCVDTQKALREFCRTETKLDGFDLPDPIAMAVAIAPDAVTREAHLRVEIALGEGHVRGQTIVDHLGVTKREPNCRVVYRVDRERFISMLKAACA